MDPSGIFMAIIPELLSTVMTLMVLGCIVAAVFKIFVIGNDLTEMKDLLRDIKRNTGSGTQPGLAPPPIQSTESLMRAVHGDAYVSRSPEV